MIARRPRSPAHRRRRGVVLILVLSMLGLLAVIGVSFATFSGQARSAARFYATKLDRPRSDDLIEFAIRQLINDTTNPMSALYGHGLKRDMYGNDAADNDFYDRNPDGSRPAITAVTPVALPGPYRWDITTNIPNTGAYSFIGWTLTIPGNLSTSEVAQTFHVVDNLAPNAAAVSLRITGSHAPLDVSLGTAHQGVGMIPPRANSFFSLDGRYRHAFNGTGMAALARNVDVAMTGPLAAPFNDPGNRNPGQFANYRVSGSILDGDTNYTVRPYNVNLLPADEDYDAPDLENWFLAVQSADGSVVIPSFHRPGILALDTNSSSPFFGETDMTIPHPDDLTPGTAEYRQAVRAISRILRPRPVDHPLAGFSDLSPDPATGRIQYDVDNDGDGVPDSVWLDVGYPVQRSEDGRLYKPLVSFMVLGLNGRLPLNTAGNLNSRLAVDDPATPTFDEAGLPLFDHASHLGYSPSEINPKYALQNAPDPNSNSGVADGALAQNSQFDNAQFNASVRHIPLSVSQLRSLLTGTRLNTDGVSGEQNTALIEGGQVRFHNNTVDNRDILSASNEVVRIDDETVAGRWGEPDAIPPLLRPFPNGNGDPISPALTHALNFSTTLLPGLGLTAPNHVRPGQSPYPTGRYYSDGLDNNLDTYDFFPPSIARPTGFSDEGPEAGRVRGSTGFVEVRSDAHDLANMPILASERFRRFVTPMDTVGIGRVTRYDQAPGFDPMSGNILPFDIGPDGRGRVSFMHYFRPPGVPLDIDDDSIDGNPTNGFTSERLIPNTSPSSNPTEHPSYVLAENRHNLSHGYVALTNPAGQNGFLMGAMPYNALNVGEAVAPRDATGVATPPTNLFSDANANGLYVYTGTFDANINSNPNGRLRRDPTAFPGPEAVGSQPGFATTSATGVHTYPLGSPMLNDPNQMNLYWPDGQDMPFGPKDLEWLYRYDDVDGDSLESRLADLAPVSFVLSSDAQTRRRLFSVETWDRIDYSLAHDHPIPATQTVAGNLVDVGYPYDAALTYPAPYLAPADPAAVNPAVDPRQGLPQVNARHITGTVLTQRAGLPPLATQSASFDSLNRPSPGVTHGGRRINLNHPLPHSYNPFEPVRQKWISETYQALKLVLPPHAIDTPQELAKLGQFAVNIVDFRDPDNAITIWDNPDVRHLPAFRLDGTGDGDIDDPGDYDLPPSIHLAYRADGTVDPYYNYDIDGDGNPDDAPLRHYGMEYQPVALNEVLAFQFNYADKNKGGADRNSRANRLYIELVNMLSSTATGVPAAAPGDPPAPDDATDLDLQGWDFVMVKEDPNQTFAATDPSFDPVYVRPDPTTGQLPPVGNVIAPVRGDLELPPTTPDGRVEPVLVGSGKAPTRNDDGSGNLDLTPYQNAYRNSALNPLIPALDPDGTMRRGPDIPGTGRDEEIAVYAMGGIRMEDATGYSKADVDDIANDTWPVIDKDFDDRPSSYAPNSWDLIPQHDDPAFDQADPPTNPEGLYFWLYLRRPANPLLPPGPGNPMVVVDSIRFPFSVSDGVGRTDGSPTQVDRTTGGMGANFPSQPLYSVGRPQPFRGGQLVPNPESTSDPLFLYGSTDQARPSRRSPDDTKTRYDTPAPDGADIDTSVEVLHTIGILNDEDQADIPGPGNNREAWDYLAFNDRDFVSVAELLMVPGCPPGLFTKQFAERPPHLIPVAVSADSDGDGAVDRLGVFAPVPPTDDADVPRNSQDVDGASEPLPHTVVRTYPYLAHEFYYSSDPAVVIDPTLDADGNGIPDDGHIVGGNTGAGWHRMLELFEVPSPVLDAVGPVAQGVNFDWFRQDRRPGQINLNLVFDEEVFFGLIDDPRLLDATNLQRSLVTAAADLPQVVTQVDLGGRPTASHAMANRGFTVFTRDAAGNFLDGSPTSASFPWSGMKHSFADFLKHRHGGSGFLFAYGDGLTGTQGNTAATPPGDKVAGDRPYRSMSYFDIHRTLLRPATMEPSAFTTPTQGTNNAQNPGLKLSQFDTTVSPNTLLDQGFAYQPPDTITAATDITRFYANPAQVVSSGVKPIVQPIPPRRLFQVPDWTDLVNDPTGTASNAATGASQTTSYAPVTILGTNLTSATPALTVGEYPGLFPEWTYPGLAPADANDAAVTGLGWVDPTTGISSYLGGSTVDAEIQRPGEAITPIPPADMGTALGVTPPAGTWTVAPAPGPNSGPDEHDMRRHPYYRTELLQKVTNLTTPRTHQFAVWVTVGLFEVVRPGDRAQFIPDELGPELGAATGANVRYRSFFVIDRSRATGFNPLRPGNYRDAIVYSRRIE